MPGLLRRSLPRHRRAGAALIRLAGGWDFLLSFIGACECDTPPFPLAAGLPAVPSSILCCLAHTLRAAVQKEIRQEAGGAPRSYSPVQTAPSRYPPPFPPTDFTPPLANSICRFFFFFALFRTPNLHPAFPGEVVLKTDAEGKRGGSV